MLFKKEIFTVTKIKPGIVAIFLYLILCMGVVSYAEIRNPPAKSKEEVMKFMKTHMEKVRIEKPAKYDAMMKNAGGNITECRDCHKEVKQEKKK
jgi:hypothetical protein